MRLNSPILSASSSDARAAPAATLANWRQPPHSAWALRNIDRLIPVDTIASAMATAEHFVVNPQPLFDFRIEMPEGAELDLEQTWRETATDGCVVLSRGRIVHEFYANGLTATTPHLLMGVTRAVVGLLAGILQDARVLDPDAPVERYLPQLAVTPWGGASVRQLLDMRSGVVLDDTQAAAYRAATGWEAARPGQRPTDLHTFFASTRGSAGARGGAFADLPANIDLLGWVLESVSRQRFASLASNLLWQPLGAARDASITLDGRGAARTSAGMSATARDLASLGYLVAHGGRRGDAQVVPAECIAGLAGGSDAAACRQSEIPVAFGTEITRYRSGWYVLEGDRPLLMALGQHGQHLLVDAANDLVVAKLSSQKAAVDPLAIRLTIAAVAEIGRCLRQGTAHRVTQSA